MSTGDRVVHTAAQLCTVLWISGPRNRSAHAFEMHLQCADHRAATDGSRFPATFRTAGARLPGAYDGGASPAKHAANCTRRGGAHRVSSNAERIARLERMRAEAVAGRGSGADRAPARDGQAHRARATRPAARPRLVRRARRVRHPPRDGLRDGGAARPRRRRRHRARHHRRPAGVRVLAGLHGLRRIAVRGVRREDLQGDGPRDEGRGAAGRAQRLRRRADPGGRRVARRLRRDLPAQRAGVRRRAADLRGPRAVCRRRRLLAGDDGLHRDGRGDELHVRHRAQRREGGDPRGDRRGVARRRVGPHRSQRRRAPRGARRGRGDGPGASAARAPAAEQPRRRAHRRERRSRPTAWTPSSTP